MNYHIIKVRSGTEFDAHSLFEKHGFTAVTFFERKFQPLTAKQKRMRTHRVAYAHPVWPGYVFISDEGEQGLSKLMAITEQRPFIYGPIIAAGLVYELDGSIVDLLSKPAPDGLGRSFDPKRDARKRMNKLYGQKPVVIPEFKEGQVVRAIAGSFQGLDLTVQGIDGDEVRLLAEIFGRATPIKASAYDLESRVA